MVSNDFPEVAGADAVQFPMSELTKNETKEKIMSTVDVIIVVDALGATSSGNLQDNVYLIDSHKYMGSWAQGQCELHTVCHDNDLIKWRVASVDPDSDVAIAQFTGQMVNDRICLPSKQGISGHEFWEGEVEAQRRTSTQQYSVVLAIDGRDMTFDPFLEIK